MRLDKSNTYLFSIDNKYDLIKRNYHQIFKDESVIALVVAPDYEAIRSRVTQSKFYNGCIVGATGMHQGVFVAAKMDGNNNIFFYLSYQWWEHQPEGTVQKTIDVPLIPDKHLVFKVTISRFNSKFYVNVSGDKFSAPYSHLIDYEKSLKWVGCGNNLGAGKEGYDEDYASIFIGDISKLHIQNKLMGKADLDSLFDNYEEFKHNYLYGENSESVIFSSDFTETTPYKVKDYSSNKNNIIKYDPLWFND